MPRIIEETWTNIGFDVITEQTPHHTPQGLPEIAPNGQPVTTTVTTLVFIIQEENRVIKIPLTDEPRAALIRKLAGGIVIPSARLN